MIRVRTGGRLHFGFLNLSLAHERLYGGLGVAIESPRAVVAAERAEGIDCPDPDVEAHARRAVEHLGVPGASVRVEESLPRHVGLGSGTQLALAAHTAIARAYDRTSDPREAAPALDRGGRSGVGVAAFEEGGFVLDAGHPTERFTVERPRVGGWTVPPVAARHPVPEDWRFVLAVPEVDPGRSDTEEEASMRSVVEDAEPGIADQVSAIVTRGLLPAVAAGDLEAFGRALSRIGRLNGVWYADEQGGVYRPPVGAIVDELAGSPAVSGVDQSSWGPLVYGVTDASRGATAAGAAREALDTAGVDGDVIVTAARNEGARVKTVE